MNKIKTIALIVSTVAISPIAISCGPNLQKNPGDLNKKPEPVNPDVKPSNQEIKIIKMNVDNNSITKDTVNINIELEIAYQNLKEINMQIEIVEKTNSDSKIISKQTINDKKNLIFVFNNLKAETKYKINKVSLENNSNSISFTLKGIVENIEFQTKSSNDELVDKVPKNEQPGDPGENNNPGGQGNQDNVQPINPKQEPNEPKSNVSININQRGSNLYASQFLQTDKANDLNLNKDFFDVKVEGGVPQDQVALKADSFDDEKGELSVKADWRENNQDKSKIFSFKLNKNLLNENINFYSLFVTKNKTNNYKADPSLTDDKRADSLKSDFNGKSLDEKLNILKQLVDFKFASFKDDNSYYPNSIISTIEDMKIHDKKDIIDHKIVKIKYKSGVYAKFLNAGSSIIQNKNLDKRNLPKELEFELTPLVKIVMDSILVDKDKLKKYQGIFPTFFVALSDPQNIDINHPNSVNLSYSSNYYSNNTDGWRDYIQGLSTYQLFHVAMNSIFKSNLFNNNSGTGVIAWLQLKNIELKYFVQKEKASDIEGTFTLEVDFLESAEGVDSKSQLFKRTFDLTGFRKWDKAKDLGPRKNGFNVAFNDSYSSNSVDSQREGMNWSPIFERVKRFTNGEGWVDVPNFSSVLTNVDNYNNRAKLFKFKYNNWILNAYPNEEKKWPVPLPWFNSTELEITNLKYNKNENKLMFEYTLTMEIQDKNKTVRFSQSGSSTATFEEQIKVGSTSKEYKIVSVI